jgi:PEGA domain-containing protein
VSSGNHASAPSAPSYTPSSSGSGSSSASGDSGRTAHPTDGDGASNGPQRQPPTHGTEGHRGGGGYHGGGGYYGGYHYPYYYPYGYYGGFWPGLFSWWWGDYYPYPYGYGYGYGHGEPYYYGREGVGALDLDVYPGRTEVYVDGQFLGKVDAFDGWPRYLWLPKGTYDVAFYLDGYKTIARQITVYPGSVIDVDDRMEPGESVRPENLATKTHERRDERLRYERERRDQIDRGERGDDDEDWHDRVHRERGTVQGQRDDVDVQEQADSQKGRLRLDVEPEDASVYLDGHFVGTGSELSQMRNGLPVSAGDHRLAIVRPGRKAEERQFQVKPGEDVELDVELEETSGR